MTQFLISTCYISKICLIQSYRSRYKNNNKKQRWKRIPLKDPSPNINFPKTFITYYQLCYPCFFSVFKYIHDVICNSDHFHSFNQPTRWHHIIGLSVINLNHCKITLMFLTVLQDLIRRIGPSFLASFSCISCADPVAHSSQIDVHILFLSRH